MRRTVILGIVIVVVIFGVIRFRDSRNKDGASENGRIEVQEARASEEINRDFDFPLRDGQGQEVSKIKLTIEKAEIRDEIIVKGKKASSIKGRTFLVLNLKVKNEYNQAVEIETRDYVRLAVNKNEEDWLAPEVYNDPVEVQAISTKYTRVGFTVNETDKDFVLRIGEIGGEKERVEMDLKI